MSNSDSNDIRAFAMSTQLIEADLAAVEKNFSVKLSYHDDEEWQSNYYPQFDETVRFDAESMSRYYQIFYCLEKTIRTLITDTLKEADGSNWWDSGRVPANLHTEVAKRIKRDIDSGFTVRSTDPIDFTNFGELGEIIKSNWDLFGSIFGSSRALERIMANLNMLRGPIAHCGKLAEDEILRLELSVRDWFRLME